MTKSSGYKLPGDFFVEILQFYKKDLYLLKIGGILKFSIIDVRIKSGRESTLSIC